MPPDQNQPVLEAFVAIALLAALALLATSARFRRLRRSRAMTMLISGGWLAVGIGVALGPSGVGLVEADDLLRLTPVLMIGLGWIGMMMGLQLRRAVLGSLPGSLWRLVGLDFLVTLVAVGASAWIGLGLWLEHAGGRPGGVWRLSGVILLVACTIGWAMETRSLRTRDSLQNTRLATFVRAGGALGGAVGVALFGVGSKVVIRDPETLEQTISFITAGQRALMALLSGALVALLGRYALHVAGRSRSEALVVFLGVVTLLAGVASALDFSPLFAAMLGGAILANISGSELERFERFILQAEHVVAALFALLAGVLIDPAIGVGGAALALALVASRFLLKPLVLRLGAADASTDDPPADQSGRPSTLLSIASVRQGPVAIALGVGLVLAEPSVFHQRLLAVVVLAGLLCEGLPIALSVRAARASMQTTVPESPEQMRAANADAAAEDPRPTPGGAGRATS